MAEGGDLEALFDARRGGRAWVSWTFLGLCVSVFGVSLAFPELRSALGGVGERRFPWQPFTAVLVHGWPGFPAAIHLALNAFLILECGRPCERLLGSARFLVLCLVSTAANAGLQLLSEGVNGSSLVIWSWGPALFLALRRTAGEGGSDPGGARARIRGVLVLVYVVVPLLMGLLPFAFGWRGNPLVALLMANQFHLVATAVGALAALAWRGAIRDRILGLASEVAPEQSRAGGRDRT